MNIDISIHQRGYDSVIHVGIHHETKPLWQVAAFNTRRFIEEMQLAAAKHHSVPQQDWPLAQKALERMYREDQGYFEFEEARIALGLIGLTAIYYRSQNRPWSYSKKFVRVMAQISHCWIPMRMKLEIDDAEYEDLALQSYHSLSYLVSTGMQAVSVAEIHRIWQDLQNYTGQNQTILGEREWLGSLCRPYDLILKKPH